jgi:cytidine deaminase
MNKCPCCSNTLLKHWEQKKTYWYCGTCRQKMPNLELADLASSYQEKKIEVFKLSLTKS